MRFQSIGLNFWLFTCAWGASVHTFPQEWHAVAALEPRACPNGLHFCGKVCANLKRNRDHCGACGTACGSEEVCVHGKCESVTCTNVIDCANGVAGGQVHCGAGPIPKTARCFCSDVDGSSESGICTLAQSCENFQTCTSSDDCDINSICSLKSCCNVPEGMGMCIKKYAKTCANPSSATRVFQVGDEGAAFTGKMSDGS